MDNLIFQKFNSQLPVMGSGRSFQCFPHWLKLIFYDFIFPLENIYYDALCDNLIVNAVRNKDLLIMKMAGGN